MRSHPSIRILAAKTSTGKTRASESELELSSTKEVKAKNGQNENISKMLERHYFSGMLDSFEAKGKTIPNPVQILEKIRQLQTKAQKFEQFHHFRKVNYNSELIKMPHTNFQKIEKSQLTPKTKATSEYQEIHKLLMDFVTQMGYNNQIQLSSNSLIQMIHEFLSSIQKIFIPNRSKYEQLRIKNEPLRNTPLQDKHFRHSVELQKSPNKIKIHKPIRYSQESYNINIEEILNKSDIYKTQELNYTQKLRTTSDSAKNRFLMLSEHDNPARELFHNTNESIINLKVQSDNNSQYLHEIQNQTERQNTLKETFILQNQYKQLLQQTSEKAREDMEKLAQFWKNYLLKVIDQYETDIAKLKEEKEQMKKTLELYQREINRANSFNKQRV